MNVTTGAGKTDPCALPENSQDSQGGQILILDATADPLLVQVFPDMEYVQIPWNRTCVVQTFGFRASKEEFTFKKSPITNRHTGAQHDKRVQNNFGT